MEMIKVIIYSLQYAALTFFTLKLNHLFYFIVQIILKVMQRKYNAGVSHNGKKGRREKNEKCEEM